VVQVFAVVDDALSPDVSLGDAIETFIRREKTRSASSRRCAGGSRAPELPAYRGAGAGGGQRRHATWQVDEYERHLRELSQELRRRRRMTMCIRVLKGDDADRMAVTSASWPSSRSRFASIRSSASSKCSRTSYSVSASSA
jgi:hypothetical protein